MPAVPARESRGSPLLFQVRRRAGGRLLVLRVHERARRRILRRLRRSSRRSPPLSGQVHGPCAGRLHPETPGREDPHLEDRPRRGAQAGHRPLRRSEGLDGAPRRPRPRGGAEAPRSRPRADDGGRPPLRGHGQPGHGRWHHGPLRRAARPRGPRRPRLLCRVADAGVGGAVRGRGLPLARPPHPDPRGTQLRRGRCPCHRVGSPHGLHRGRSDDAPRGPHGANGDARHDPDRPPDPAARRGLRAGRGPGGGRGQGPAGPRGGLRAHRRERHADPAPRGRRAGTDTVRRPRRRDRADPPRARPRGRGPRPTRRHRGGTRRGEVPPRLRVHPLPPDPGLARPGSGFRLLTARRPATCRSSTSSRPTSRSTIASPTARSARR